MMVMCVAFPILGGAAGGPLAKATICAEPHAQDVMSLESSLNDRPGTIKDEHH